MCSPHQSEASPKSCCPPLEEIKRDFGVGDLVFAGQRRQFPASFNDSFRIIPAKISYSHRDNLTYQCFSIIFRKSIFGAIGLKIREGRVWIL